MKVRITHPDVVHDVGDEVEVSDDRGQRLVDIGYAEAVDAPVAEAPNKSAKVGEWREYAQSQGLSAEDAEGMSKAELVERYS